MISKFISDIEDKIKQEYAKPVLDYPTIDRYYLEMLDAKNRNRKYLKALSGVELYNEWVDNYMDEFPCLADFEEFVHDRKLRHY